VVSNLYVKQANLKVILELTGSQCSSDRRAVAGRCKRLGKVGRVAAAVVVAAAAAVLFVHVICIPKVNSCRLNFHLTLLQDGRLQPCCTLYVEFRPSTYFKFFGALV